jgi:hypothetical protein
MKMSLTQKFEELVRQATWQHLTNQQEIFHAVMGKLAEQIAPVIACEIADSIRKLPYAPQAESSQLQLDNLLQDLETWFNWYTELGGFDRDTMASPEALIARIKAKRNELQNIPW